MTDYNSTFTSSTGSTIVHTEVDTQFDDISTAINSKINSLNLDLLGTATIDGNTLWHQGVESHNFATNGYQILPNGLIIQWGLGTAGGPGSQIVNNYNFTFPTDVLIIVACTNDPVPTGNGDKNVVSLEINSSQFQLSCVSSTVVNAYWIALGT